ncbi:MAG: DUF3290 domain-containing protein [[Lactobacillus] timonensis]|uniref:DUF3290 domain-containing protein n=1 Tax=[Lactobacillus] timonensis TaxID=1970790 RepID=UPI000C830A99|nr:DUF3290 domain-containing protein [[Lactobacillus] timonensis]MCI1288030.1 DUF3290 domain-containing protein [[Lactobacillus] timonensis]MCI1926535.1 DUF3290 domain-containing protein [[Lactobacillus] timonensis]MCI1957935.1 DUF3290 domain-containing protein [[Lactobacillus] timonensis]MCI1970933.1 DUF3290 domain-containing protein [[Lactobacillus] timonensis]MCI2007068.1 DUF3290 domain-containing protein [[Lactobacillus] timonensis]
MTFYTYQYLSNHQQINSVINYAVILTLLCLLIATFIYYLRHRLQTKYRDIGIIILILLMIFCGLQVGNMEENYTQQSEATQMKPFIEAVARDHGLKNSQVVVNSTNLKDGIIVRFHKKDYRVNFSPNGDNYTLTRTHVVDHHVYLQK